MPRAFVDWINEVAIKQKRWFKDVNEYCTDEVLQGIIATLDGDENILLKNYTNVLRDSTLLIRTFYVEIITEP